MNNIWSKLEEYFFDDRDDYYCGLVEQHEIEEAQQKLNLKFCDGYINFIKQYGGAMIRGNLVYGFRQQADMGNINWSVIDNTNFYKNTQKWPDIDDWYIISDDGSGNPIGCKLDGSVWLSDHDAGFEQVKLANNFEEFLEKLLEDRLYE